MESGVRLLWPLHPSSFHTLPPVTRLPAQSVVYPVRIESSSSSLAHGHTLDLNCLVASQAPHTITWYKRGGSLPRRHQVLTSGQGRQKLSALALIGIRRGSQHLLCARLVIQQTPAVLAVWALDQC